MALFNECTQSCARIVLDMADIVRDGDLATPKWSRQANGTILAPTNLRERPMFNIFQGFSKPLISLAFMFVVMPVWLPAQERNSPAGVEKSKSTMRKLYELDQSHADDADRSRYREQVQQLLRTGKIQSAKDYYYAAFIFQHGQKPSEYLYAHVLAVTAVNKGLHTAIWLSAATLDRYLQSVQRPQIFGTQYGFGSRDDQEPYDREMLSDALRTIWCVAPQLKQSQILND